MFDEHGFNDVLLLVCMELFEVLDGCWPSYTWKMEFIMRKKIVIIWERLTKNHLFYGAVGERIHHIDIGTITQNSRPLYFPECQSNKLWNVTGAPRLFGPTEIWRTMLHLVSIPRWELYVHGLMERKRRTGEWVSCNNTQRSVISH